MGKYTMIADVSQEILRALKRELVPELIIDKNGIGLCSPQDSGEYSLGVFLYDIQENDEIRRLGMLDVDQERQKGPPQYLSLYYMITAYAQSDQKFRTIQEERILGRILQYFHDYPVLQVDGEETRIQLLRISTEDKTKLWNFGGKPYMVSIFYKVSPVMLESSVMRDVVRVRRTEFGVGRMGNVR